jgi:hypothetical protein
VRDARKESCRDAFFATYIQYPVKKINSANCSIKKDRILLKFYAISFPEVIADLVEDIERHEKLPNLVNA